MRGKLPGSIVMALFLASCANLPDVGNEGQPCSRKGNCLEGLVCSPEKICVNSAHLQEDGGSKDTGSGADGAVPLDSGNDAGTDAGPSDAGGDVGIDVGTDGGTDTDSDAQVADTGPDAATDAGADAETDAGSDTGIPEDSGADTGTVTDANADTGTDAETDGGSDTGQVDIGLDAGQDDGGADSGANDAGQDDAGDGGTVACGEYAQPCCVSDVCNGGFACNNGTCVSDTCGGKDDFTLCRVLTNPDRSYDICVGGTCVSPGCRDATCNEPGPHFSLPDTSQRKCYNTWEEITCPAFPCLADGTPDFCGQDAQYGWDTTHAQTERFTKTEPVSGEPLVTDNITGLEWQGCPAGLSGSGCLTGTVQTYAWSDALVYCEDLSWAGYTDWRLPDIYEFQYLVDYGRSSLSIDPAVFPATPPTYFWSSTSNVVNPNLAWYVPFGSGGVNNTVKTTTDNIRCVRGIPIPQPARFSRTEPVAGQPVVADKTTWLVWQGCAAGLTGSTCASGPAINDTWQAALKYCEGLTWGNQTDWRLPNAGELFSLFDASRSHPAIDPVAFPATPSNNFWSSTTYAGDFSSAVYVNFDNGGVNVNGKLGANFRCVRSGKFDAGCDDFGGRLGWMCNVPEGPFMMGCNSAVDTECQSNEDPYHAVTVPAFKIDKDLVTSSDYRACVTASGCIAAGTTSGCNYNVSGKENHPINCVDWNQAKAYCTWAGKRLPTEAEWEKAARGTDGRKYPWGNTGLDCDHAVMSVSPCSNSGTAPVGSKPLGASPFGTEDMVGNLWEWVEDWYHDTYTGAPSNGSAWVTPTGSFRVLRGGSWYEVYTRLFRASARVGSPSGMDATYGFRCAQ